MSPDPVAVKPELPTTFNRYVYANNNPYKYVDPDGKFAWMLVGAGITMLDTINTARTEGMMAAARSLARDGAISIITGGAGKLAMKAGSKISYAYYMRKVEKLDVSTARNSAVFYSGPGNRQLAEEFALANNKTTLEMTAGGKWLDDKRLFDSRYLISENQAAKIWERLSMRYAESASGTAIGFVQGSKQQSIFNKIEYPSLYSNNNINNVITGGF